MTCIAPAFIPDPERKGQRLRVKCGGCRGCLMDRARDWSLRGSHELRFTEGGSSFVTLTYDDFHLPCNRGSIPSLCPPHMTLFIKRLRKALRGRSIRYLLCGEYGSSTARPHYHLIIFGCDFSDPTLRFNSQYNSISILPSSTPSYSSSFLSSLWTYGSHHVSEVTPASISYVCQYSLKKVRGKLAKSMSYLVGQVPEFVRMSQGIGREWADRYASDYSSDDLIVFDGKKHKTPRYYLLRLKRKHPERYEALMAARREYVATASASERDRKVALARLRNPASKRGL